jgi:hypothetical protein
MAAGLTANITQPSFNAQVGSIVAGLDGLFVQVGQTRAWIIGAGGGLSGLEGAPLSYAVADATNVFNTFADLDQLRQIYQGLSSQSTLRGNSNAYDYRTNGSLIGGTLIH